MAFPPAFLDRLRGAILLPELIGKRVNLRKSGREWVGCCPFHQEKSGSFRVYDDHYHCYGCNAHGDAIEFIKQYEHLEYREAVEKLAREAGIPLPEITPRQAAREEQSRSLYGIMEASCRFFQRELQGERGLTARRYLETRGITPETIRHFRLGYAPDARDALKRVMTTAKINEDLAVQSGMLVRPEQGSAYDRFRGRLMFPIMDAQGRVIAFGGRILTAPPPGKQLAKYLNSPETPLFKKGEHVYNLHHATKPGRSAGEMILVEGYMDTIAVAQAGIAQVGAPLGTAITPDQLRRLWLIADAPILCLDGDAAGMRAMLRAAEIALPLLTPGKSLRFAALPKGEDPDSLIAKAGVEQFRHALSRAQELHEVLLAAAQAEHPGNSPSARAALEKRLMAMAETIQDATTRAHFRTHFKQALWSASQAERKGGPRKSAAAPLVRTTLHSPHANSVRPVLKTLLLCPQLLEDHEIEDALSRLDCPAAAENTLRNALLDALHAGIPCADIIAHLQAHGYRESVAALMQDEKILIPKDFAEATARPYFQQMLEAHYTSILEEEYRATEAQAMAGDAPELYERLLSLQKELQERRHLRLQATLTYGE